MEVFKVKKDRNYTVINNTVARDKRLSLKAKGFFLIIMSLPEDWDFSINGIVKITKEGKTAIYSAMKELINFGYCQRSYQYEKLEGKKVRSNVVYTFYEVSNDRGSDLNSGNLNLGSLNLDNQPQLNTNINKVLKREALPDFEIKEEAFKKQIKEHSQNYDHEIISAFYNYYTQKNPKTGKMHFQEERYWDTGKRLKAWNTRERKMYPPKKRDRL